MEINPDHLTQANRNRVKRRADNAIAQGMSFQNVLTGEMSAAEQSKYASMQMASDVHSNREARRRKK